MAEPRAEMDSCENNRCCYPRGCSPCPIFRTWIWGNSLQLLWTLFVFFVCLFCFYGSCFCRNLIFQPISFFNADENWRIIYHLTIKISYAIDIFEHSQRELILRSVITESDTKTWLCWCLTAIIRKWIGLKHNSNMSCPEIQDSNNLRRREKMPQDIL